MRTTMGAASQLHEKIPSMWIMPLHLNHNNLEKTDPSEIERTYNIRKQQTWFYSVYSGELMESAILLTPLAPT